MTTLPSGSFCSLQLGRGVKHDLVAVAQHDEGQRIACPARDQPLHVGKGLDPRAFDRDEAVAGHEAGFRRGAARLNLGHRRLGNIAAVDAEHDGEDGDRQQEIEGRAGEDGERALPHRLDLESHALLGLAHRLDFRAVGFGGHAHVTDELDVAAERNCREFPACSVTIIEAEKLRSEADREGLDADAAQSSDNVVAHLVDEDHHREDEEKGNDRADQNAVGAEDAAQDRVQDLSFWLPAGAAALRELSSQMPANR